MKANQIALFVMVLRRLRNALSIAFCLLAILNCSAQLDSIYVDNSYRSFLLHTPPSYNGSTATPLIIGMHGGFGRAEQFAAQSLLSDKSDQEGFLVVYPNGTGFNAAPELRFWNAGTCCAYPFLNNIDDVGFIRALIDSLSDNLNIDANRIYATGMSNGAFMAYTLGCELSDRIAAIAPVAGGMLTSSPCTPTRPMPVVHFHSFLDSSNVYYGGVGNGVGIQHNPPIDSVMDVFSDLNGCSIIRDTLVNTSDYTHFRFSDCECLVEQQVFVTQDGGHSWPGGTVPPLGDPVSTVINANDEMWDFFQQHTLDCLAISVQEENAPTFRIYPNPSNGQFTIESPEGMEMNLEVMDLLGKVRYSKEGILGRHVLDLGHLPAGVYLAQVSNGVQRQVARIVLR